MMSIITLTRTTPANPEFQQLIKLLDEELWQRNGALQNVLGPFNLVPVTDSAVIATIEDFSAGCGCFKVVSEDTVEIKRMFVHTEYRERGIATMVLQELETWARDLGFTTILLETSKNMVEAIQLYKQNGYCITEKYPPYVDIKESVCMQKFLNLL